MSGSKKKRFKREKAGVVTLADIPKQADKPEPSKTKRLEPYLTLRREEINAGMEAWARGMAAIFEGTKIGYEGQWYKIGVGNVENKKGATNV